jgi:hypothetical protein
VVRRINTVSAAAPVALTLIYVTVAGVLGRDPVLTHRGPIFVLVVLCSLVCGLVWVWPKGPDRLSGGGVLATLCPFSALGAWDVGWSPLGATLVGAECLASLGEATIFVALGHMCVLGACIVPAMVRLAALWVPDMRWLFRLAAAAQISLWIAVLAHCDLEVLAYAASWIVGRPPTVVDAVDLSLAERLAPAWVAIPVLARAAATAAIVASLVRRSDPS